MGRLWSNPLLPLQGDDHDKPVEALDLDSELTRQQLEAIVEEALQVRLGWLQQSSLDPAVWCV